MSKFQDLLNNPMVVGGLAIIALGVVGNNMLGELPPPPAPAPFQDQKNTHPEKASDPVILKSNTLHKNTSHHISKPTKSAPQVIAWGKIESMAYISNPFNKIHTHKKVLGKKRGISNKRNKATPLVINGITTGTRGGMVIINGKVLAVGDVIDGMRVEEIRPYQVFMRNILNRSVTKLTYKTY